MSAQAPRRDLPLAEYGLALAVLASLGWTVATFRETGYLPQPFVFDTNDSLMDWFNPALWANRPGAYDVWGTIYPPLSFVFLDLFSLPGCQIDSPFHARDCDWLGQAAIGACYLLNVALLWVAFRRNDPRTAIPRTVAMALGLPLLFTLERGNLILPCLPAFILAFGPVSRSPFVRATASAVAINFKPYLLVPMAALALRREWRPLELAGLATVIVYLLTLAWMGGGTPMELASNTAHWIVYQGGQLWSEVNYSTSYKSLVMLRTAPVSLLSFVPSRLVEGIEWTVPLLIRASQCVVLLCAAAAWLQPAALGRTRLALLLFGAYLITQSPGGYTQVFLLFLVMLEPWQGAGPRVAIVCAYLLCLVGDIPIATIIDMSANSWLSGRPVTPSFGFTVGHFVRPGLIILIVWALALDSLAQFVRAHRWQRPTLGLSPA